MASISPPIQQQSAPRRIGNAAITAPRLIMSWEDWLTFAAAFVAFVSVAVSLQQANWVTGMPEFAPTVVAGLLIGMVAARTKYYAAAIHPAGLIVGLGVVVLLVQGFAEGETLMDRLADFRVRMVEWFQVVRDGDISNDDLPFVTLAHVLTFLAAYFAAWSIFRWRNAWLAVIPAGVILLTNISFLDGQPSGAFLVFLFGSIILIARLHLQANMDRWKRQGVEYPEFISISAIQLTVVTAAVLVIFAWNVPLGNQAKNVESVFDAITKPLSGQSDHLVRLFHNIDSRKGANLHGFGDTLPIQGEVTLGTKELFEVQVPEPGLLRATSYDFYTGNGWKVGDRDSERVDARDLAVDAEGASYEARDVSILRVTVKDAESTLLTPGSPLAANVDVTVHTAPDILNDIEKMVSRRGLRENDTYNSFGSVSRASEDQLRSDSAAYPDWVIERYLQLPDSIPDRVEQEARRVVDEAGATNTYDRAKAIEQYLRGMPFDLNVISPPPGRDATDFLLFDLKRGYFDYTATAMAVMLRELGIPARVAVGYVVDPGTGDETTYTVRKDNAYSWVEVFFPTYGWINFNPTADRPEGGVGGVGNLVPSEPFELPDLGDLFPDGGEILPEDGNVPVGEALAEEPVVNTPFNWALIWGPLLVLALLAAVALSGRFAWNWGLGGLDGRARLWAKTQRLSGWVGLGSRPAETPREWSRRMGKTIEREDDAVLLSNAYEEARYGRPDLQRIEDEDANTSYRNLRGALVAKLLRRKPKTQARA